MVEERRNRSLWSASRMPSWSVAISSSASSSICRRQGQRSLISTLWPWRCLARFSDKTASNSRSLAERAVTSEICAVVCHPASAHIQQSFCWHERRSALVLDQEHQEFRRLGTACVPVNEMNIVGAFIEGLSWCQCYLLSTLQLHHNGALQYVNKRMCIVSMDSARPAGCMLYCDYQNFPAGILRQIFGHERCDLRLLSHRRAGHKA